MPRTESTTEIPAASPPARSVARDRDVDAGFPVKRLVLMLVYANMICLGGVFASLMAYGIYSMVAYTLIGHYPGYGSGGFLGFFQMYGSAIDQLWDFATDDASQSARFLLPAIIPGTFAGIGWYLVLRWRESVILKKRLIAARAKAEAGPATLQPPVETA